MIEKERLKWPILGMKKIDTIIRKIRCFIFGHKPYEVTTVLECRISLNRKGGKKRGAGVHKYRRKRNRYYCSCCGRRIK